MKYTILVNRNENIQNIEAQEQARFIKSLFETLEIPINWNPDEPLSVIKKLEIKKQLLNYGIQIVDDMDGGLKIFASNELIGEWKKCTYKLREDYSQIDPKDKLYLEVSINFWSSFENQNK